MCRKMESGGGDVAGKKAVGDAKTKDVMVLNLKVRWLADSRTLRADFYGGDGGPLPESFERKIEKSFDTFSLIAFVRRAVDDHVEYHEEFMKSLNASMNAKQSSKK
jgi:hypothetical protein